MVAMVIRKGFTSYSPWLEADIDGLPVRKGVPEASAVRVA